MDGSGALVDEQGLHVESLELLASLEAGQLHDEGCFDDLASEPLDEPDGGRGGASGGDEVVDEDYLLSGPDGVGVDLDLGLAVLRR